MTRRDRCPAQQPAPFWARRQVARARRGSARRGQCGLGGHMSHLSQRLSIFLATPQDLANACMRGVGSRFTPTRRTILDSPKAASLPAHCLRTPGCNCTSLGSNRAGCPHALRAGTPLATSGTPCSGSAPRTPLSLSRSAARCSLPRAPETREHPVAAAACARSAITSARVGSAQEPRTAKRGSRQAR